MQSAAWTHGASAYHHDRRLRGPTSMVGCSATPHPPPAAPDGHHMCWAAPQPVCCTWGSPRCLLLAAPTSPCASHQLLSRTQALPAAPAAPCPPAAPDITRMCPHPTGTLQLSEFDDQISTGKRFVAGHDAEGRPVLVSARTCTLHPAHHTCALQPWLWGMGRRSSQARPGHP